MYANFHQNRPSFMGDITEKFRSLFFRTHWVTLTFAERFR